MVEAAGTDIQAPHLTSTDPVREVTLLAPQTLNRTNGPKKKLVGIPRASTVRPSGKTRHLAEKHTIIMTFN